MSRRNRQPRAIGGVWGSADRGGPTVRKGSSGACVGDLRCAGAREAPSPNLEAPSPNLGGSVLTDPPVKVQIPLAKVQISSRVRPSGRIPLARPAADRDPFESLGAQPPVGQQKGALALEALSRLALSARVVGWWPDWPR
jgi:hypothetical protein